MPVLLTYSSIETWHFRWLILSITTDIVDRQESRSGVSKAEIFASTERCKS
ncbi:MAG: hypothetical protein HC778_01740 [Chamaesiphon sp. CSU_1_12]|nr:hypothetical protein [Chamaesiphon sp. CSU_1_12]